MRTVVAKSAPLLSPQRSRGLHPLLVPPLRGLRTTSGFVKFSNLEQVRIWNFTNPRERCMKPLTNITHKYDVKEEMENKKTFCKALCGTKTVRGIY